MAKSSFVFNGVALLMLIASSQHCNANPNGAPTAACADMIPQHGFASQTRTSPFVTIPLTRQMMQDTFMPINLVSTTNDFFKGFLVMAFDASQQDSNEPIGSFMMSHDQAPPGNGSSPSPSSKNATSFQSINCFNGLNNAATHVSNDDKTSVILNWMPPRGFVGQVVFKVTYVQNVGTYWMKTTTPMVDVLPGIFSSAHSLQQSAWISVSLLFLSSAMLSAIINI